MSLDFKLHYDRLRENDPTKPEDASAAPPQNTFYAASPHTRNLCLIWPDGRQHFINYAYLVSGELSVAEEKSTITLNFSAYTVTLRGFRLEPLFQALLDHLPRFVVVSDERYAESTEASQSVVTEIAVVKSER